MAKNYYEVLGIKQDASISTIRRAYRRQARELHPDTNPNTDPLLIQELNEAYETLKNAKKRSMYDSTLNLRSTIHRQQALRVNVDIDLKNAVLGGTVTVRIPGSTGTRVDMSSGLPKFITDESDDHSIVDFEFPAGIQSGAELTLDYSGGDYDQIIAVIHVRSDDRYGYRDGKLWYKMALPITDFLVGAEHSIPVFEEQASLTIKPGDDPRATPTVTSQGIEVVIQYELLPVKLSKAKTEAIRKQLP